MRGVHRPWSGLAWVAALLLPACAPPSPQAPTVVAEAMPRAAGACNAEPAQGAVGQPASPQRAETARQLAGAQTVRVIGHDDMVTKEYDTSRLNLQLDERGRVVRVYCG